MFSLINFMLAGSAAAGAVMAQPRDDSPYCIADPLSVNSVTLKQLNVRYDYEFRSPSQENPSGHIDFALSNEALSYEAKCSAVSDRLDSFFYGEIDYQCDVPEQAKATDAARFTYNLVTGEITVTQSWSCPGNSAGENWQVQGKATYDLTCHTTTYTNPNWTEGQTYSDNNTVCDTISPSMPVTVESLIAGGSQ